MHFGVLLQPQNTAWDELRTFGLLVDQLGYDSLWAWDHFVPLLGGGVERTAARLHQFWKAGARGYLLNMSAPFDRETLERFANEVRPRVLQLIETEGSH